MSNHSHSNSGAEHRRVLENKLPDTRWHRWGPYLSERQWGTVREDYSADGDAWNYLSHDYARSQAYRWGEDGIGGLSDRHGLMNLAFAFWNGKDPILKERMFGLTNSEGNHGEDVKECYWFQDATPTHSYLRMLYRYPQNEFPYTQLIEANRAAGKFNPEVEITDLDVFKENRYFEISIEYAKETPERIYGRLTIVNCGPEKAQIHVLPTLWFRNTWSWNAEPVRPGIKGHLNGFVANHPNYGSRWLVLEHQPPKLFTENETNRERLYGTKSPLPYVKDSFHRTIINGEKGITHPEIGTKAAAHYVLDLEPGEERVIKFALLDFESAFPDGFDELFAVRIKEAEEFYVELAPNLPDDVRVIQRAAFAGLIWCKQFYRFDVDRWLKGDKATPCPPATRHRNEEWKHFNSSSVISMPDTWEYPWFAAWDLAFHTISFALIDAEFAKKQLLLLTAEWFMHPNGQLPAYEWNFSDVNPPVHAWAAWRVYLIERRQTGKGDTSFLKRIFHKLLLTFTWWVNRKDKLGNNVFEGGFLGLDNIGVFDRNEVLPDGSFAEQSDGTAWMGMFCLNMLEIALELARTDNVYEEMATKFFEHFLYIAAAINGEAAGGEMWDNTDGFYYDVLRHPNGQSERMKIRSVVGLIPLFAVTTFEPEQIEMYPEFRRRLEWFLANRADLRIGAAAMQVPGKSERLLLSLVSSARLARIMKYLLDPEEFLSPHGIRAVSRFHREHPYELEVAGAKYFLDYEPGASTTEAFGGNSNWRGPVWMPINYLLIESLQKFDYYFGDSFKASIAGGEPVQLNAVAADLENRLLTLFRPDTDGNIPIFDHPDRHRTHKGEQMLLFHEYFHADTGRGLGASHQTGWTGVIAKIIQQLYVTTPGLLD
jgi:hypothetical protein